VLYTDNYYTSIKLAKHMYEKYGWTIVGTIVPTDKKHREADDFPFLKLSIQMTKNRTHKPLFLSTVMQMSLPVYGYDKRYAW